MWRCLPCHFVPFRNWHMSKRPELVSFQIADNRVTCRLLSPLYKSPSIPTLPSDRHHLLLLKYISKRLLTLLMFLSVWICQIFASKYCFFRVMSGAVSSFDQNPGIYLKMSIHTNNVSLCLDLPNLWIKMFCANVDVWRCLFFLLQALGIYVKTFIGTAHVSLCLDLPNLCIKIGFLQMDFWRRLFFPLKILGYMSKW